MSPALPWESRACTGVEPDSAQPPTWPTALPGDGDCSFPGILWDLRESQVHLPCKSSVVASCSLLTGRSKGFCSQPWGSARGQLALRQHRTRQVELCGSEACAPHSPVQKRQGVAGLWSPPRHTPSGGRAPLAPPFPLPAAPGGGDTLLTGSWSRQPTHLLWRGEGSRALSGVPQGHHLCLGLLDLTVV